MVQFCQSNEGFRNLWCRFSPACQSNEEFVIVVFVQVCQSNKRFSILTQRKVRMGGQTTSPIQFMLFDLKQRKLTFCFLRIYFLHYFLRFLDFVFIITGLSKCRLRWITNLQNCGFCDPGKLRPFNYSKCKQKGRERQTGN